MKGINWIGVVIAVIVSQAVGFLWYGMVFSEQWMALSGITAADAEAGGSMGYVAGAVQNLVVAIGLGWLVGKTGMTGWAGGGTAGLLACVFFALATYALRFIYGTENAGLIPIDAGYMVIQYVLTGAIVGGLKFGKPAEAAA